MGSKYYLGVDGGGTKTTAVVFNEKGEFICKACGESINYYSVGFENARNAMSDIINRLSQKDFDCAVIGMSALSDKANESEIKNFCSGIISSKKIIMDSDLYVALEAMNANGECAVIISGTGSMAICRNADGAISHAGGFGYILGDEGSGYSIGLSGIKAAIRGAEKVISETSLTEECISYFSVDNVYELINLFYDKGVSRKEISAFAKNVMLCAENGDQISVDIINSEADALSLTALSLLTGKSSYIPVGLWGGVFQNNRIFKSRFESNLLKNSFKNIRLLNFTPEIGAIFACYRNEGVEITDRIKNNIISTYK